MLTALGFASSAMAADTLTQRSDNGRNGRVVDATITNALFDDGKWQKLGDLPVDASVWAQPLFKQGVVVNGATRDIVIVATAKNTLYAFDAATRASLWGASGVPTPLGAPDLSDGSASTECANMSPNTLNVGVTNPTSLDAVTRGIGIQSTPVIDSSNVMYVTYRTGTTVATAAHQWLARVSLATGTVIGSPKEIQAADLGGIPVSGVRQRASLLLSNGVLYVAFGSHCEDQAIEGDANYQYRGVLLAYDPATLNRLGRFETVPSSAAYKGAGIWQASTGPAADASGNLYFTTGNILIAQVGDPTTSATPSSSYVPNSFVKLKPVPTGSGASLAIHFEDPSGGLTERAKDWYTPARSEWHNRADLDLGSAGVILPPNTNAVVGGGKEGVMYSLDRSYLGGYPTGHMIGTDVPSCVTSHAPQVTVCDLACYSSDTASSFSAAQPKNASGLQNGQKFQASENIDCPTCNMGAWTGWPHIHGTPVFGGASDGSDYLYLWPEKDRIKAFKRNTATSYLSFDTTPITGFATTPDNGMPGGMLTLAAGTSSSVIFGSTPSVSIPNGVQFGAMAVFDGRPNPIPNTTSNEIKQLWGDYPNDAVPYVNAKFVPPTVANGKVYLATFSHKVVVYGRTTTNPTVLLRAPVAAIPARFNNQANVVAAVTPEPAGTLAVFGATNRDAVDWPTPRLATLSGPFPPRASVSLDTQNNDVVALAVANDSKLHVYWTSKTGAGTTWSTATVANPTGVTLAPGSKLATQHRGSELDVFVVDNSRQLRLFSVTGALTTSSVWSSSVLDTSRTFPPGGGVAADIQGGSWVDVIAVSDLGQVRVYAPNPLAPSTWLAFQVPSVTLLPGAQLATGHRQDELDVFAIGGGLTGKPSQNCDPSDTNDYGCLKVMSVTGTNGSWSATSVSRIGVGWTAPGVPGSAVTTVQQTSNQLDVLFVSTTGVAYIYASVDKGAFPVFPTGLRAQPGSPITAVQAAFDAFGNPSRVYALVSGTRHGATGPAVEGVNGIFGITANGAAGTWSVPWRAL